MITLDKFLAQQVNGLNKRAWIDYDDKMSVYLRYPGRHLIGNEIVECFDIATVETLEEFRGQGVFTRFLDEVEFARPRIYIENVMEKRFQTFFENRGYECVHKDILGTKCFFKTGSRL